jgi:hypothetical protein
LQHLEKNNSFNNQWIFAKDFKNKIKEISQKYAHRYKANLNRQQLNIIYMAGLFKYFESLRISQQD